MANEKNNKRLRLDLSDMRIGIKDLIFIGGIIFGAFTFYFTTTAAIKAHTQEIEKLKTNTVSKEIYDLNMALHEKKDADLEKAIKELTKAVTDLRIEIVKKK